MPIAVYRNGRVGVLASVILLMSIVLFIGSIYWLVINGPWGVGSLFGKDLFKPASMSNEKTEINTDIVQNAQPNISEAVNELEQQGCVFTKYNGEYSSLNPVQLNYSDFKELAIDRKLVFTVEINQDNVVLLVIKKDVAYEWGP
jgi:hypothetical protein